MTPLKLIFMGTPDFAAHALKALVEAGHDIVAVYSQPPRPAGRGHSLRKSPVQLLAEEYDYRVHTPEHLKTPDVQAEFAAYKADAAVVAAFGLILPQAILDAPRLGCLNIHASLLPRWRGAAPIQRAILAGDETTGISIMRMEAGLDTGPVLLEDRIEIERKETAGELHDRLALIGARAIVEALDDYAHGRITPRPQPHEGVTYAAKISSGEARLYWDRTAVDLERAIRAFSPVPGAWALLPSGERLKVLAAEIEPVHDAAGHQPGDILDDRLTVLCGEDALRPTLIQREGKKAMPSAALLRGLVLKKGDRLS
ncbi:methionyl-tRNA formyltransferase [Dongia sedimenti]|uniref:Methionyl-tRNA formyltransferase n=1 Tax=Dongia sedimenti TaxID=3064282 RepID=A0ABU0YTW0_9PROT|nr:methionyl-tRNA formyltransferase [Rhodospirillaceae bacterium R-7]